MTTITTATLKKMAQKRGYRFVGSTTSQVVFWLDGVFVQAFTDGAFYAKVDGDHRREAVVSEDAKGVGSFLLKYLNLA